MAPVITEYASWILFAWILANQGGLPVPVMPALLGAAALAGSGRLSIAVIFGATVCAHLGWYSLGRWRGARALDVLGRVSPQAAKYVRCAEHVFLGHLGTFQLVARFLPELAPEAESTRSRRPPPPPSGSHVYSGTNGGNTWRRFARARSR